MYGLDLIIVSLWFLPLMLFIIIPLALACLWGGVFLITVCFGIKLVQSVAHGRFEPVYN